MRKVIVSALVSLDGVFGQPGTWASPYFDDAAAAKSLEALESCDAMLMGRGTYEYFAPMWSAGSGAYVERINAIRKYVFSSTLTSVDWTNSTLVSGDVVPAVTELVGEGGGDLMVYGYGRLGQTLAEHDLIDELTFSVHPVLLGGGDPIVRTGKPVPLELGSVETGPNGVVALTYVRPNAGAGE